MAETNFVTANQSWQKVSNDLTNVILTSRSRDGVQVYVGSTDPDSNSAYHWLDASTPFSMAGVSGQDVWVKAATATNVTITVTAV